jgi:hypothetical protein
MQRLVVCVVFAAAACARDARPDAKAGKLVPAQLVRCAVDAPSSTPSGAPLPDMSADFQIDAHGKVRDIHVQGAAGATAKALRRHLESCEYDPATRDGRPIATRRAAVFGRYDQVQHVVGRRSEDD